MTIETLRIGFREQGFGLIYLVVRKNNNRGINLYQRLGFSRCGESKKEIQGKEVELWHMEINHEEFCRRHDVKRASRRALLVIDVQNDYIGGRLPIEYPPVEVSLPNIGKAMDAASAAGVPVVVIQNVLPEGAPFMAKGTSGAELHPTVAARSRDHKISKSLPSAFAGTSLEDWLRERQVDTVAIAGYMTHNCDLSTAVQAVHAGFAVELLSDATGSLPYANAAGKATAEEIHRVMTVVMQSRFAAVMPTEEWISMVQSGEVPRRDTIYASNLRARQLG